MQTFNKGTEIRIEPTITNAQGSLVEPSTSVKVLITNKYGVIAVNEASMSVVGSGLYRHDWASSPTAHATGRYDVEVIADDGGVVTREATSFELE